VDFSIAEPIVRTLLYEGYRLYPYRTSSLKNREPCAFGSLYPKAYSLEIGETEPWSMQTEFLLRGDDRTRLEGRIRYLHRTDAHEEAREREWVIREFPVSVTSTFRCESTEFLRVTAQIHVERPTDSVFKVCVRIENQTPIEHEDRSRIIAHTMASTHALFGVKGGQFLSLIDPPDDVRGLAESCRNRGVWPILVGDPASQDMLLAAPIILYDYPQVAPESPGNLFDATEIDELLTLRILTLTDSEKHAMRSENRTRTLLERTERLDAARHSALHGTIRDSRFVNAALEPGVRVRLRPRGRADILDLALSGQLATVESIEQDFEGGVRVAVTVDDDPGQDLGAAGRPGHRFFFRPEEVEQVTDDSAKPRFLVAGVGNLFRGDDAFGSEVARRLIAIPLPPQVRVMDFGIRGHDLAFALQDGYETVILLDVMQRGATPGLVSVVEPDLDELPETRPDEVVDTHGMHPARVLRMIQSVRGKLPRLLLVSCEPLSFGPDEGQIGLSKPVAAAVDEAVARAHSLLQRMCADERRSCDDVGPVHV
jgi:hydrogenase maturation protease